MSAALREKMEEAHRRGLKISAKQIKGKKGRLRVGAGEAPVIAAKTNEPEPLMGLHEFMRRAWHVVEPATPFIDNWHLHVICEHLEACARGRTVEMPPAEGESEPRLVPCGSIRDLLINMPPRCEKSLLVSVFFPAWVWTFRPSARFIYASYGEALAIRDGLKSRRILQSVWYKQHWGKSFHLISDQNAKTRYENSSTGFRICTSVNGLGTGEGADFVIVDDPHNVKEAESDTVRDGTVTWWNETMSSRYNNPKTFVKIVVMQRVHEEDLSGDCIRQGIYEHLCLPMEYEDTVEAARRTTSLGFSDPRNEEGELLWPSRFDRVDIDKQKHTLGEYGTAGQLQQRPTPRGGGMFPREKFRIVPVAPICRRIIRYWDKAATEGGGCHTAGVLLGEIVIPGTQLCRYIVLNCVSVQLGPHERNNVMQQTAQFDRRKYGARVRTYIEREGGSSGVEAAQSDLNNLRGYAVKLDAPTGDKITRALPFAGQVGAGNVDLLEGEWNEEYLSVLSKFPKSKRKDEVDASSGAYNKMVFPDKEDPLYSPETAYVSQGWHKDNLGGNE